jgi:hypothetical protein
MTQDFLHGMIVAMLPSVFFLAFLLWRAPAIDDSDV